MTKSGRSQLARAKWQRHIAACLRSGQSVAEWCESNDVSAKQWYFWRKLLAPENALGTAGKAQRLIPVSVTRSDSTERHVSKFTSPVRTKADGFEVIRIDKAGASLQVVAGTDVSWLAQLLRALT